VGQSGRSSLPIRFLCDVNDGTNRISVFRSWIAGNARQTPWISGENVERTDIEQVLRNWLDQATSAEGRLPEGADPAAWVAQHFAAWWHRQAGDALGDAEAAAARLRGQLNDLGYPELAEALHELTHVQDALAELRRQLGLADESCDS